MVDQDDTKNTNEVPDNLEEQEESKDAVILIKVSKDRLTASIYMEEAVNEGAEPSLEMIKEELEKNNVVYGVDIEEITKLANEPIYNKEILIATGTLAEDEEDAYLTYHIRVVKDLKPKIDENGRVDFHDIGIVENIEEGQLLCTKIPVKNGKEGKTVIGTVLFPKKGKDINLPAGKNTKSSEDKLELFATSAGTADCVGNKINVLDTFVVQGDVGPKTGNINFVGNVVIHGNVLSGYSVTANGNININGIVEAAHIKAEGSITIYKGVNGIEKGILESGENINCKYMENCTAIAESFIYSETILNCQIKCGKNLELMGRRGMLIGGSCIVGENVLAKNIGSDAYIATEIELGKDPELFEKHIEVKHKISSNKKELNDLNQVIKYFQKLHSLGKLPDNKKKIFQDAMNTRSIKIKEMLSNNMELANMEQLITQRGKGKIVCSGNLYPGTKISIGSAKKTINNAFIDVVVIKKDGNIVLTSSED